MPLAEEATGRTGTNFFARLLRGGVDPFERWAGSQTGSQRVTFGLWATFPAGVAAARDARLAALRGAAEAAAARRHGNHQEAARQQALAVSYQAVHDAYRKRETMLATVMADRAGWGQATRRQRQLAVASDAELRRHHPGQPWPPLRSAKPSPRHPRPARRQDPHRGNRHRGDSAADNRPGDGRLSEPH